MAPPQDEEHEMAAPADEEDERQIELEYLCATFPEIVMDPENPCTASIDLPVVPSRPIQISFTDEAIVAAGLDDGTVAPALDTHYLAYLPSLNVKFTLPAGYPKLKPPLFELSTSPSWLPTETLQDLQAEGQQLWEDFGHDQVLFAFIDKMQDAARDSFGIPDGGSELELSQAVKISLLDFNIKAKKEAFDKETFDCGICLDPKKGSVCHRMMDCGHVFCVKCLQDFYNNAIKTGDLSTVRCLAPDCAKKREANSNPASTKSRKPRKLKTSISPSELLQIPIEDDVVKRYVTLRHKADLESDKNTVYCPRKWCQGAARNKKYRKPEGLEIVEGSDSDSEEEENNPKRKDAKSFSSQNALMRICEDCSFAFCSRCFQSWHGEYFHCLPRNAAGELTAEDKASLEYMKLHSTACPTCTVRAQKTHGCNHMICFQCGTHFCYLCSAWLYPENPYKHYNIENQGCYMRLWELEGGDGDDVGVGFAGGNHPPENEDVDDEEEDDEEEAFLREGGGGELDIVIPGPFHREPEEMPEPLVPAGAIAQPVREGPLVIRIDALPARPPQQQPAPLPPQPNRHQAAAHRRARGRRYLPMHVRNQPLPMRNELPPGLGMRPLGNALPLVEPLQPAQADLIPGAPHLPQQVAQREQQNRNPPRGPAQRGLLAVDNMDREELLHQRAWLDRFVNLANLDQEDDWDSDDDDGGGDGQWEIQPR